MRTARSLDMRSDPFRHDAAPVVTYSRIRSDKPAAPPRVRAVRHDRVVHDEVAAEEVAAAFLEDDAFVRPPRPDEPLFAAEAGSADPFGSPRRRRFGPFAMLVGVGTGLGALMVLATAGVFTVNAPSDGRLSVRGFEWASVDPQEEAAGAAVIRQVGVPAYPTAAPATDRGELAAPLPPLVPPTPRPRPERVASVAPAAVVPLAGVAPEAVLGVPVASAPAASSEPESEDAFLSRIEDALARVEAPRATVPAVPVGLVPPPAAAPSAGPAVPVVAVSPAAGWMPPRAAAAEAPPLPGGGQAGPVPPADIPLVPAGLH